MYRNDPDSTNRTTLTLIIAFIAASIIFIADQNSSRFLQRSKASADTAFSPVLSLFSKPIRATENIILDIRERRRALEENKILKQELYQLREAKERAEIMEMKLLRFEQILKTRIGIDIPDEKIAARAVSETDGPFVRAALINVGSNKGVKVGHPVLKVDGLYGHVVRVGLNSARVLRLGDLNSRIAIMSADSQATAILAGRNNDFPEISFMSDLNAWKVGDAVITSGDDGVLPRGLPIGIVRRGADNTLGVELNVDRTPTDWIFVYPFQPITAPEDGEVKTSEGVALNEIDEPTVSTGDE